MRKPKLFLTLLLCSVCRIGMSDDLLSVYQQALEADPELRSSEVKIKIGEAQKGQALGEMLPQITASGNWSANKQTQAQRQSFLSPLQDVTNNYGGTRYVVSINQTLLDLPKYWNWQRSKSVESQYTMENIQAQQTLLYNVVERYFGVLEAEDELKFYKSEEETTAQQLKQIQKLFDRQLAKITDLYALEARLDQVKASIIEAEAKVVTAKESLKELTNISTSSLAELRDEVEYKELEGKLEDWLEVGINENPALSAQQYAIEAADNDVATQKARHMPVVELQLTYYNTDTGFQSTRTGPTDTQVAAINVNLPIFSGGTTTKRTQEAQHKLTLNKYAKEAQVRELVKETSDAFLNSNASVRRINATRKSLESTHKSREAMEMGFSYGVETISDVLNAQQEEYKAMRDLAQAKYSYIKNRMRFLQAIGTISEENLNEVNKWLLPTASTESKKNNPIE
jgi:outer membrane protein